MDSLDMIECLYKSFTETDSQSREAYRAVFLDYLKNIYKQLNGNQEEIINGLASYMQEKIDNQDRYKGKDIIVVCLMAGRLLQEVIDSNGK